MLTAAGLAVAVAGCTSSVPLLSDASEGGWFSKPVDLFSKPTWASATSDDKNIRLGPSGPVAPEELVGADGRCGAPAAEITPVAPAAAEATATADRPVGSMAGDLAGPPMPAATPASINPNVAQPDQPPGAPQVMGGIALGMNECDVARRAGLPGNVAIGAGDKGERKVVLTYLSGSWPGIYTFSDGRLKEVNRAPTPPPSARPPAKKKNAKKPARPKSAVLQ
jgi:hypothetical protein